MTTTDRMSNLDSRREITDRVGETVILGNSVGSGALESDAIIVAADFGASSEVTSIIDMDAVATLTMQNASFGIWAVDMDIDSASLLSTIGASINNGRFSDIATSLLTWGADAMLLNIRVFTSTQSYTPTTGTAKVVVICVGGGGGGGASTNTSANNSAASGGGAGSTAMGIVTSGFSGITITVAAAASGGASAGANGNNGNTTSFGGFVIASGGTAGGGDTAGGVPRGSTNGVGGASSGTASLYGSRGEDGDQGFCITTGMSNGGRGGNTPYGSGGLGGLVSSSGANAGVNATGFGAGGGGGASVGTAGAAAGGSGAGGLCIVFEYNA